MKLIKKDKNMIPLLGKGLSASQAWSWLDRWLVNYSVSWQL